MIKKYGLILIAMILIVVAILVYAPGRYSETQENIDQSCPAIPTKSSSYGATAEQPVSPRRYEVKKFDFAAIAGLSTKQLEEHNTLYEGYVQKRNEIAQKLVTVDLANQNRTYSPYRALKIAETYALNGSLLHELYFENMNKNPSTVGEKMRRLIDSSFGSFEKFKADLTAAAMCSRGWAITCYSLDDHLLHNYVLEEHNQTVPVLAIPLIVLDVYEHAYMIDFGIKRAPYIEIFLNQIDWNIVEKRIDKWVTPLGKK